ncbi:alpha-amylase family protein [Shewanella cyperi]|nr:alpha-amylase family protein [Shewanella cyperi]QSX39278.1 alpha-amylase family protein [Shewanella cyperi]
MNKTHTKVKAKSGPNCKMAMTALALCCFIAPAIAAAPEKAAIYQIFTRLYGNDKQVNKPWGTVAENGVGKFADIDDKALADIKALGITHVWYTGVLHHASVTDYSAYGIGMDDPDVVKGRAGSPYAIRDYYNVDPDLARDPDKRLQEFEALIKRSHNHGLKVIMDIVPNHVARGYDSVTAPDGVKSLGADDNSQLAYSKHNDFYYVPGADFQVPDFGPKDLPLGGAKAPGLDGQFAESPAKWTGNGSRSHQPRVDDWYETVKINYGLRPDGSHDFPSLPADAATWNTTKHGAFWQQQDPQQLPSSWAKMRDIARFWLVKGVDGFRYDMAEMVPVEFWSYLNSDIKRIKPDAMLLAEVYDPSRYRDYLHLGKMDFLYDKVGMYDTLKAVIQGRQETDSIGLAHEAVADIAPHMLHFLENHDEQRIASPEFAGDPRKALPAMVVSSLLTQAPTLVYFAQELGEDGSEDAGFGKPSRTSIFDYVGVPTLQRYRQAKRTGVALPADIAGLRRYYQQLLTLSLSEPALRGELRLVPLPGNSLFGFIRQSGPDRLLVLSHFGAEPLALEQQLSPEFVPEGHGQQRMLLSSLLTDVDGKPIQAELLQGKLRLKLPPYSSAVFRLHVEVGASQ